MIDKHSLKTLRVCALPITHLSHPVLKPGSSLTMVPYYGTIQPMKSKHNKTLASIYHNPVKSNIAWSDIEKMLISLGAEISEGAGSRVRIYLNGIRAVFHRPHPQKETDKGAIQSMRRFLTEAGVKP